MLDLSIISIILYFISGLLFIVSVIMFFMTDVIQSIQFVRQKNKSNENVGTMTPTITVIKHHDSDNVQKAMPLEVNKVNIAKIQTTVDAGAYDSEATDSLLFQTMDCNSLGDVSFVVTRNIIVCHTNKEYV